MGGIISKKGSDSSSPDGESDRSVKSSNADKTNAKVVSMLAKKKGEVDKSGHTMTFEKILLSFGRLRTVLGFIRGLFMEKSAGKSGLQFEGLKVALEVLHGPMEKQQVVQLFDFVDIDDSKEIEYKEFLVALTTGHVLGTISPDDNFDHKANITLEDGSSTTSDEIKNVLNLIVSAYLLFDPNGRGFIERNSVGNMIDEGNGKGKTTNAMLSKERWDEMDWDSNGTIDFAEFVFAFSSWVDINEDDE
mmetsp:Transcript_12455/g.20238  ORF Transcript_12455/g.20238 Transcript_12455/m.20238 type:complete len:247 (-) Transcript_12455:323-1063(-)